jgi:hypothetical protein
MITNELNRSQSQPSFKQTFACSKAGQFVHNFNIPELDTIAQNGEIKTLFKKQVMKMIFSERIYDNSLLNSINFRYYKDIGREQLIPDLSAELVQLLGQDQTALPDLVDLINFCEDQTIFKHEEAKVFRDLLASTIVDEEIALIWAKEFELNLKGVDGSYQLGKNYAFNGRRNLQNAMNCSR